VGEDWVQVRGILLNTTPPLVLGSELFPMTSVRVAETGSLVPFEVTNVVWLVCCDPVAPTSSVMFWIGQVSKKSRTGDVTPWAF
jgi:hypothetical protein